MFERRQPLPLPTELLVLAADHGRGPNARLGQLVRAGELTPRELVELYLGRIERLDMRLNASVPRRHRRTPGAALRSLRAGEAGGLLGTPDRVVVNDNVDIAGEVTTHRTRAQDAPARADTEEVRRPRRRCVGRGPRERRSSAKTTLPELATAVS